MESAQSPPGIDVEPVTNWIAEALASTGRTIAAPLRFDQIAGGRSNLTFRVSDADGFELCLRRPPTGHVLATAHDMGREHRVMAALVDTPVPVPTMVGLCEDDAVNGAPFYVMDWVPGTVVRSAGVAERFDVATRRQMGISVVQNLAKIHEVDVDAVGLGDFAKRDGYVERQIRRWMRQVDATEGENDPTIVAGFERLSAAVPEQKTTRLVHGDYRLDNTIVDDEGNVAAVLDWELTTLGDPLADLGAMLAYWSRPGEATIALSNPPTLADGFLEKDEVVAVYEDASGATAENISYYHAFALWRLACILDGVVTRYRAGSMGRDDDFDVDAFADQVSSLSQQAINMLDGSSDGAG